MSFCNSFSYCKLYELIEKTVPEPVDFLSINRKQLRLIINKHHILDQ